LTSSEEEIQYGPTTDSVEDLTGFTAVYKEAYSGSPYYEYYTDEQVRAIYDEHRKNGHIILARIGSKVVGLWCTVPLSKAPEPIQEFLSASKEEGHLPADFAPETTWYMSEMAVLKAYRHHGIAYKLLWNRLIDVTDRGSVYYVMRTASEDSNSMGLYRQLGAEMIPSLHDVSDTDQVTGNGSQSKARIYIFGKCRHALAFLTRRLGDSQKVKV
jgi:GNAT superfamily N-acetyltransferase